MDRETMLEKIDTLYRGRQNGDRSAFASVLAPDATFRFVGNASFIQSFPGGRDDGPDQVAAKLFEQIDMLERTLVDAVVEGNRAATHFKSVLRVKGGEPFEHEMFDLWEFDDEGRIIKGSQFQDTAKIIDELDTVAMAKSAYGTPRAADDPVGGMDFDIGSN
ncbi:nuclear transport factor 2 family protein [Erythrobacter sp. JK5]|uniref:nuclear transport factor 2 family protein n=1 Tax=Erythrobacter sp. JK5 TaxID=2829500 RepID=UPI001BA8A4F4|nr:nuclear transport factor 2 family protein [Erythrobacter sp. JK5]QUL37016.1 nuclear transport factor 2 family protein [Erythrobacter sp. JK5]